jgi:beta-glucosidase
VKLSLFLAFAIASFPLVGQCAEKFLWGVSNAAFQTEGEPADSDWYRWANTPGKIEGGAKPEQAFGFYSRYEIEFDLAKTLGSNAFRMSIAWERVEPEAGKWDEGALTHYEDMLVAMRKRGLEPVVTLHHYVNPVWLKEGLLTPDFPIRFAEFAEHVVNRLANGPAKVRYWITFNEPEVLTKASYIDGDWPPGVTGDLNSASQAMAQLMRAHVTVWNQTRPLAKQLGLKFGIAKHYRPFQPRSISPLDWLATRLTNNYFNRQVLDGFLSGKIDLWAPGMKHIRESLSVDGGRAGDFIGVNYYGRTIVQFTFHAPYVLTSEGDGPKNDIGWEIYPKGMLESLRQVGAYGLPMLITENGIASSDDRLRPDFIAAHIAAMREAMAEGLPVIGYLHWTLTDNLEWARGFGPKFGLCAAPRPGGPNDVSRCRPSFSTYRDLISKYSK